MRLSFNSSNNIYIRNLAPDITEDVVRDTFKHCDEILSIQFKSYHGSTRKYCIVEFKTYAGITNGSLLNGTPMLGLPLEITVTDPVTHNYDNSSVALGSRNTIQWQYGNVSNGSGDDPGSRQRLDKTIYIENIPKDYDKTDIRTLFSNIGDIVGCCIEPSSINPTVSAIVEFNTNFEAEEALKLDGITVNNHTLKIERSKLLVFENAPLPGVLDLPLNLVAEELPVRSTTINAKMAKVLEMREKLSRKLSYQQTDASNRTERDDDNTQWWLDISKRRRYYGRRRSRSSSTHYRSRDKYSSRRHRYGSRSPSSSSSGNSRSHSRRRRRRSRSRSRRHKRS